ncbi:hypothetical protein OPQ81_005413 [Rhizoctonia solani]|nr:hypothetical protein OPQ81_005413 [Rhizoctonia solani]
MATLIEIAGIVLASTSLGGQITSTTGGYFLGHKSKRAAEIALNNISHEFDQLKSMRKDLSYDQYLSETESQQLDETIEKLALDLGALRKTLRDLKGINYWAVKTYYVQWCDFDQQNEDVLSKIIEVNVEIRERSIREKQKRNNSEIVPPCFGEGGSLSARVRNPIRTGTSEYEVQEAILNAVADEAANAIRLSIESRVNPKTPREGSDEPLAQGRILADGTVHISSPSGRKITMSNQGTASGIKWRVPFKSLSAPPSITLPNSVELQDLQNGVD